MIKKIFGFILLGIGLVVIQYFIPQGEKKLPQETFAEINPIEFLIDKMDTPPEGLIVSPRTTEELKAYFKASDENHVPRIFVDKLPTDFAQKGTNELWAQIISALILRTNEVITKERAILILLTDKFNHEKKWTPKETEFFDYLVQKYDSKSKKTIQAKLND